jgi:hypothetical protein
MKVTTANEHLARIPSPKTEKEFEAAWKKTEELRTWVGHGSDRRWIRTASTKPSRANTKNSKRIGARVGAPRG